MPLKPQGRIFNDITETMGGTPLVRINRLIPLGQAIVLAKCEFFNPLSSVKDRIGVAMIEAAERDGRIDRDTVIVEPTSGNTGTALAEVIKPRKPSFKAIAVEPVASPVITQTLNHEPVKPGRHKIQGIGAGFVPENLHTNVVDEVVQVTDEEAFDWARRLHKEEG